MRATFAHILIQSDKVDVNVKSTHDDGTPLHVAIQTLNLKDNSRENTNDYDTIVQLIEKLLCRKDLDFDKNYVKNGKGQTCLDMAKQAIFKYCQMV